MEKVNVRNAASSKSNACESKGKQDVSKCQRLPKYKESTSPHPEPCRKPTPQKCKAAFDKRPRTRTGIISERYRNEVVQVDSGGSSCIKQGCKKINLNHLLNFTLTPIESRDCVGGRLHSKIKLPKYNKELFLQANCQFVARDDGDYTVHYMNPDILVDWSLIEEVRLPSHEIPSCPICLYAPTAAKITRCGHIYCWPCILHYLSLTDKMWQKCPICFEAVYKTDLKSVLPTAQVPITVGNEITMCLMKREKGSLFPVPSTYKTSLHSACNVDEDGSLTCFQKLLLAKNYQVFTIINRERWELQELLSQEKDAPESCFIESALQLLDERKKHMIGMNGNDIIEERFEVSTLRNSGICQVTRENSVKINELHARMDMSGSEPQATFEDLSAGSGEEKYAIPVSDKDSNVELLKSFEEMNISGTSCENCDIIKKGKEYYFYQAINGQHIYLHNINIRMLMKEYGALEKCPPVITAKIVELERISMTEVLRKRLRYLQHLPLTCEFQVAELHLDSFLLSKPTVEEFAAEVQKRRYHRNRKAREERKRERIIEVEENKKIGKFPGATYNLSSVDHFPVYDPISDPPLSSSPIAASCAEISTEHEETDGIIPPNSVSSIYLSKDTDSSYYPVTSFAQMLREGKAKPIISTPSVQNCMQKIAAAGSEQNHDSDCEEYIPAPEFHQSFSEAIQAAFDNVVNMQEDPGESRVSKKKKKSKKKLLFTTSMNRSK